jgi:hypothetical protein
MSFVYLAWCTKVPTFACLISLLEYPTYNPAIFRVKQALFFLYGFVDTLSKSVLEVSSQSPC